MKTRVKSWLHALLVCIGIGMSVEVSPAAEGLSAGAARCDITPDVRLSNWVTHRPYGEVLDHVFVRAVVLAQDSERIALVSWELLYPMEGIVARVRQELEKSTGISGSNVLISATHNHSAPWSPVLGDPLTVPERKVLESFLSDPLYPAWTEKVVALTVKAVRQADAARRPATLALGRAYVGDVLFNRRPLKADGTVQGLSTPANPYALPQGLRFGPMDPTVTVLSLRTEQGQSIATLFNLPCHAVAVYPSYDGISCDWPGTVSAALEKATGGEALFLQGCAGDIVPARRGLAARDEMAKTVTERVLGAVRAAETLRITNRFRVAQQVLQAPATDAVHQETGRTYLPAEVQVLGVGDLSIVALAGEPLISLALEIQKRSPCAHTIVLGYSNGYGVQYVGMPGDKARGGYEMGARSLGTDACGQMMIDTAVELLNKERQ